MASSHLQDTPIPVRYKLAALWTSTMFCYVYGDYFQMYVPGKLQAMQAGQLAFGAATQGALVGTTILMAVPSLMIVLSLLLPPAICRWLKLAAGLFYAAIMLLILFGGAWTFYLLFATIEVVLTLLVVAHAWRWPRAAPAQ